MNSEINWLERNYIQAANDLSEYKGRNGLVPGAAVVVSGKDGVIAEYGEAWQSCNHMSVMVQFADGKLQQVTLSRVMVK